MNKHSPIVSEFESEEEEQSYLRWLEAKVAKSRANPHPGIPHDEVMAEMRELLASKIQQEVPNLIWSPRGAAGTPRDSGLHL